jgi:ketosteroid isomerase-like protein
MTTEEKIAIGRRFHDALTARDWPAIRALLTDDAKWMLPGDNLISGKAIGADDVTARAQKMAGFGLTFALERILVSPDNFALSLHNTATRKGRILDEHLATVCFLRDGKIAAIETYLSDVAGMNAFFV